MTGGNAKIKMSILAALEHAEAEDGLYLRNFSLLHEEDERPCVEGAQPQLLAALNELIEEGKVVMEDEGAEPIFFLPQTIFHQY